MCLLTFRWNSMTDKFSEWDRVGAHHTFERWQSNIFLDSCQMGIQMAWMPILWWNKDAAFKEGQKASSEVSSLEHKVSVIDGNEPLIEDLNWQPWRQTCHYWGVVWRGVCPFYSFTVKDCREEVRQSNKYWCRRFRVHRIDFRRGLWNFHIVVWRKAIKNQI